MFERNITGIVILVMQSFPVCCPRMSRQAAIIAKPSNNSGHVVIRPSSILHFTALSCYRDYYTKTFGAYSCGSSPAERNKQPPWQQQRQGRTFSSLLPSCYYCLSALVAAQLMTGTGYRCCAPLLLLLLLLIALQYAACPQQQPARHACTVATPLSQIPAV